MKPRRVARSTFEIAQRHYRSGHPDKAESLCRQVLLMVPDHLGALSLLGKLELQSKRIEMATRTLERVVELAPNSSVDLCNLGAAYRQLGLLEKAAAVLTRAVQLDPKRADALCNLGLVQLDRGDGERGLIFLKRAAEIKPESTVIARSLSKELLRVERFAEAATCLHRARASNPKSLELSLELLEALDKAERFTEAEELARDIVQSNPELPAGLVGLGRALSKQRRFSDAVDVFRRLLELEPNAPSAVSRLGYALAKLGRLDEAIDQFDRAVTMNPTLHLEHSSVVFHAAFSPRYNAEQVLAEARRWNAAHAPPLVAKRGPHPHDRSATRRLRVGYVSPDFRAHVQRLFTVPVFRHHDHAKFEIVGYSSVRSADAWTETLEGYADEWHDVARLDDGALAQKIRDDRIDVLVDLTMHMAGSRLKVFAEKPAPVQISWLAYPGTTGVDGIDYRITDPHLDPPGTPLPYSEESLRLPHSFWCFDPVGDDVAVHDLPMLSTGYVTFGCLNNFMKVNRAVLALWARVMNAVPGSRLILLAPQGWSRKLVTEVLDEHGVRSERLELVDLQGRPQYLATHNRIDLALDTFPYNGHTTSLDAFFMGVPVVTLVGETVVGRAGLCMAANLGLVDELVARDPDQFVELVVRLCSHPQRLAHLRKDLRSRMEQSPLMNALEFTRNLEAIYREAWRRWCSEPTRDTESK